MSKRLSDDVLDHWASEAKKEPPGKLGSINLTAVVGMLIAEVRASRAREAELAAEARQYVEDWQAVVRLRDALQQRIDGLLATTYASDDGTEYVHSHRRGEGEPECPACWAHGIRVALVKD